MFGKTLVFLAFTNSGGISGLFLRIVPTTVVLCLSTNSLTNGINTNQLSMGILLPVFSISCAIRFTILAGYCQYRMVQLVVFQHKSLNLKHKMYEHLTLGLTLETRHHFINGAVFARNMGILTFRVKIIPKLTNRSKLICLSTIFSRVDIIISANLSTASKIAYTT